VRSSGLNLAPGYIAKRAFIMDKYECGSGFYSKEYIYHPIENIGGGDAFTGGLLYALTTGQTSTNALEFAVATSVLKQTVPSDVSWFSAREVRTFAENSSAQSIVR
jgi:2-dehydro-3-deoxygluconokinase